MGVYKYTELIHYLHAYVYKYTELPILKEASLPDAPVGAAPSPVLLSGAAGEGAERAALVATCGYSQWAGQVCVLVHSRASASASAML